MKSSVYDFTCKDINGNKVKLSTIRGKVVIIVNVASLCGFAPQFHELQNLYEKHQGQLVILAFPCNQFGNQEPYDGAQLQDHIRSHFNAYFPIMAKCEVNGDYELPLFTYLKDQYPSRFGFKGIQWNFEKFLLNRHGKVVGRFTALTSPSQMEGFIDSLIAENYEEKE